MPYLIRELLAAGLLHADVDTLAGKGLHHYLKTPQLDADGKLAWVEGPQASADTGTRVAPAQAAGSTRLITPRGIGRVRIGMTLSQARRASHRRITGGTRDINPGCSYARVPSMKLSLMMINHRISRIETRSSRLHTTKL